jgi:hypothetical protein
MADPMITQRRKGAEAPSAGLTPECSQAIVAEVKRQVDALVKPHAIGPDDALFMAYTAGYMAAMHSLNKADVHAVEIFNRARGQVEKLRPFVAGNGS